MRGARGRPLLNQHVQLAPHHVDEELDPASFHQVTKQPRRDLEPVRVNEEERGRQARRFIEVIVSPMAATLA